jgi:N-acyl-D-aspartate/D-glutamate deacylase
MSLPEPRFDTVLEGGLLFDGRGGPGRVAHVALSGGQVVEVSETPLPRGAARETVDARGLWVMPGFVDLHTHYDAEIEVAPALSESLRHGVTTIVLGSCSLSLAIGTPEDLADMFCRVEAIPYEVVRPLLEEKKSWSTLPEYLEHLGALPLGPNVASFLGHSAMRAHVMGIERSLDRRVRPGREELGRMEGLLGEALDEGYLGLSIQTLPWDKMGGSRPIRSRPLPSTFARWSEYRRLNRILRERGRIFQGVPNVSTKINIVLFLLESIGLFRKPLKTTVISMMDLRSDRLIHRLAMMLSRVANRLLGADFRWQALPEVFDLWADGIDLVVFEEFGAGAAALHLTDAAARADLLRDPIYRRRFKRQWKALYLPKAFHRDFNESRILKCPDASVVGRSFAEVAEGRGEDAVDVFLDLVATHGAALRWYTVMANDRRGPLEAIVRHPDILVGFSDAGAHLRNMAHYNFPLRMLRLVRDAEQRGAPFMSVGEAVRRLTGEIADWLGLDAGALAPGRRADVVLVDPEALDDRVDRVEEAKVEGYGDFVRLVRRNDDAVRGVWVNGRRAVRDGVPVAEVGRERGFGAVLRGPR